MSKEKIYSGDILIIGGGVAGLTLAKLLADAGVITHVVEPRRPAAVKNTDPSSRTVALMQTSLNVLRAAGLNEFVEKYGTKMHVMRLIDASMKGQEHLECEFDAFDIGLEYFSMNIPNNLLRAQLYEDLGAHKNVTLHESNLSDYSNGAIVTATLENGAMIKTPLIVGADGRDSMVRKIAGIKAKREDYGQSAITCIINHSRSHNNASTEFHRAGGPFALVPMPGNQSSVVWVEKTTDTDEIIALPKDAFESALQKQTHDILGAITLASNPQSWPLMNLRANEYIAPRVALIAETLHVMSPITAQGLNLSLRDVAALAETMIDAMRVGADHGSQAILRNYASRRSFDITTRTIGVDLMNRIVSTGKAPLKDFRRNMLKIINKTQPLRMMAMQHGLAPSLDIGRICKGEKL